MCYTLRHTLYAKRALPGKRVRAYVRPSVPANLRIACLTTVRGGLQFRAQGGGAHISTEGGRGFRPSGKCKPWQMVQIQAAERPPCGMVPGGGSGLRFYALAGEAQCLTLQRC